MVSRKLDNFSSVTIARREELDKKAKGEPYSEAVIETCEIWLRLNPVPPFTFIEKSLPVGDR